MGSLWKRFQRINKQTVKFEYTVSYHQLTLERDSDWTPNQLIVVWCRRNRRIATDPLPWEPSLTNPQRGMVIWAVPENKQTKVTLFKDPRTHELEDKDWTFIIEDISPKGKHRRVAGCNINMKKYASIESIPQDLKLYFKPMTKKVKSAMLECTISSTFIKEGKATDADMMSLASLMSLPHVSDIAAMDDFDEEQISQSEITEKGLQELSGITSQLEMLTNSLNFNTADSFSFSENGSNEQPQHSLNSSVNEGATDVDENQVASGNDLTVIRDSKVTDASQNENRINDNFHKKNTSSPLINSNDTKEEHESKSETEIIVSKNNENKSTEEDTNNEIRTKSNKVRGQDLLEWCQEVTKGYPRIKVTNLTTSWRNGLAFCAIIHHFHPKLIDLDSLNARDIRKNCTIAFNAGEKLGITKVIDPLDMELVKVPDKLAVMTYLYQLHAHFTGRELELQQLGKTVEESSYVVGRYDTDSALNPTSYLFGQEIRNLNKKYNVLAKRSSCLFEKRPAENPTEDNINHNIQSRQRHSIDLSIPIDTNEKSTNLMKGGLTDMIRSSSKSIFQQIVRHPSKDKYGVAKEKNRVPSLIYAAKLDEDSESLATSNKENSTIKQASIQKTDLEQNNQTNDNNSKDTSSRITSQSNQGRREDEVQKRVDKILEKTRKPVNKCESSPIVSNTSQENNKDDARARARKILGDMKKTAHSAPAEPVSAVPHSTVASATSEEGNIASRVDTKLLPLSSSTLKPVKLIQPDNNTIKRSKPTCLQSFTEFIEKIPTEKKSQAVIKKEQPKQQTPKPTNYIQNELENLEREQREIDKEADMLEKYIRRIMDRDGNDANIEESMMTKWFTLVNKKNALLRRQTQLTILEKEDDLERKFELLNKELRATMNIEDWQKTEEQKFKEKLLLDELLLIVNKRDELVQNLDLEEKGIEADEEIENDISRGNIMDRDNQCSLQ